MGTQIAKREKVLELKSFLDKHKDKLMQVASRPEIADAGLRFALVAINQNPALLGCTPTSILQALMESVSLNLPPGPLGYGHFVPFKLKCTFIPDYKGLVALAMRNGKALKVDWRCVYEGDEFNYNEVKGVANLKRLHPPEMEEDNNGNEIDDHITHVYTAVTLASGAVSLHVMTRAEVIHIRNRYSQAYIKGKADSIWFTRPSSGFIKTCFKQHSKRLDLGEEFAIAKNLDDMREIGKEPTILNVDLLPADDTSEDQPPAKSKSDQLADKLKPAEASLNGKEHRTATEADKAQQQRNTGPRGRKRELMIKLGIPLQHFRSFNTPQLEKMAAEKPPEPPADATEQPQEASEPDEATLPTTEQPAAPPDVKQALINAIKAAPVSKEQLLEAIGTVTGQNDNLLFLADSLIEFAKPDLKRILAELSRMVDKEQP